MVKRLFTGNRSGVYGLWVSPPGVDASTADDFSLVFSSTFAHLQRVVSGQTFTSVHSSNVQDSANFTSVGYGQTFATPPLVVASAMASSHQLNIGGYTHEQYTDLDNVWHTIVWEGVVNYAGGHNNIYGTDIGPPTGNGAANGYWGSIEFAMDVYLDRVDFRTCNSATNTFIRYAVYKPQAN